MIGNPNCSFFNDFKLFGGWCWPIKRGIDERVAVLARPYYLYFVCFCMLRYILTWLSTYGLYKLSNYILS